MNSFKKQIVPRTRIRLTGKFWSSKLSILIQQIEYFEPSSSFQEQSGSTGVSEFQVQTLRIHVGETRWENTFCFWKSKVKIQCNVPPVRIHLKTFMGRQWLYLERLSTLRYSWEEQGVNIAPETLSIFKLFGNVRIKISIYSFAGLCYLLWH